MKDYEDIISELDYLVNFNYENTVGFNIIVLVRNKLTDEYNISLEHSNILVSILDISIEECSFSNKELLEIAAKTAKGLANIYKVCMSHNLGEDVLRKIKFTLSC